MQIFSVQKMAEECFCSEQNIKNMCQEGKLDAFKNPSGSWDIDMDSEKNISYMKKRKEKKEKTAISFEELSQVSEQAPQFSGQKDLLAILAMQTKEIKELAERAGERKQIEANLIEKQNDVEYWRRMYFELNETNKQLEIQLALFKKEVSQPFWKKLAQFGKK